MTNFLSRFFGSKKNDESEVAQRIRESLTGLIEKGRFELKFDLKAGLDDRGQAEIRIEISGADEELLKDREGQMIDSIQLFLQRVVQHHFSDDRTNIVIDCNGFREESNQALIELAEKLKGIALDKGKSVYCRALSPKDRKVVHQYLASDERVKSRSIGEGLFKKIKIYPSSRGAGPDESHAD